MGFGQALIFGIFVVGLFAGFFYWILFVTRKINPYLKYDIKYKLFKKKYNPEEVKRLMEYNDNGLSVIDVHSLLLLNGNIDKNKAKELCYIYKQIQMKGGIKNDK